MNCEFFCWIKVSSLIKNLVVIFFYFGEYPAVIFPCKHYGKTAVFIQHVDSLVGAFVVLPGPAYLERHHLHKILRHVLLKQFPLCDIKSVKICLRKIYSAT